MNLIHASRIDPGTLRRIAHSIGTIGVAGNDGDLHFDVQAAQASMTALRAQLLEAGYHAGSLAIDTPVKPHADMDALIYDTGRYVTIFDAEHAWEQDHHQRWHDRVDQQGDEWIERLRALRADMAAWLDTPDFQHLRFVDRPPVRMFEDPMRRFGVHEKLMPAFEIRSDAQPVMRFQPKGRWVIGANGRVDLITKAAAPILFDRSKPYSPGSDWRLSEPSGPDGSIPLNQESFRDLIRAAL